MDLAREDSLDAVFEECDLEDVIDEALAKVRRRRSDIEFDVVTQPWFVFGEAHGLARAVRRCSTMPPSGVRRAVRYEYAFAR